MSAATALLPGPRRAEELARLLDTGEPPADAAMSRLVDLAHGLEALPVSAGPPPEFRAALRQRLVAVASVQAMQAEVPEQRPSPDALARQRARRVQRRIAVASGAVAGVVALSGVGVAATRALPGDLLYGVKQAAESVQLWFTSGDYDRGKRHLEFAETRMRELEQLLSQGASAGRLTEALRDMDTETLAGSRDLTKAYAVGHRRDALTLLDRFTREQRSALSAVLPELPRTARPAAQASLQLLAAVGDRASALARQGATAPGGRSGGSSGTPLEDDLGVLPQPVGSLTGPLSGLLPGGSSTSTTGSGSSTQGGTSTGTGSGTGTNPQPKVSSDIGSDIGSVIGGVVGNLPQPSPSTSSGTSGGSSPLPVPLPSASLGLPSVGGILPSPSPSSTGLLPLPGTSSIKLPLLP